VFRDAASLDALEFQDWMAQASLEAKSQEFARVKAEIRADPTRYPSYWRAAVVRYRAVYRAHLEDPEFFVPVEFRPSADSQTGSAGAQAFIGQFGNLLDQWPDLVTASPAAIGELETVAEDTSHRHPCQALETNSSSIESNVMNGRSI